MTPGSGFLFLDLLMGKRALQRQLVIVYVGLVVGVSIGVFAIFRAGWGLPNALELALFLGLHAVGDRLEMEGSVRGIPQAGLRQRPPSLSAGFLVVLVCAFATDPATSAALGFMAAFTSWRGTLRTIFNAAQTSLYGAFGSAMFAVIETEFGSGATWMVLAAVAGALVAVVVNTTLVAGVLSLERRRSPIAVLRELVWPTPTSVAFGLLALAIAMLYRQSGPLAVVFTLTPLFVLRSARQGKIELDLAEERTLRAFISAVELKDPYTRGHSLRVATIATQLHRQMGMDERECEQRYLGALLHDIGKVAVSGWILRKPGPLTEEEMDVIRRHPVTGALVVSDVDFLEHLVPEVLYHHERLDGSGYPEGLKSDEIPASAQVLAVADTFEALTSDRPYRSAFSTQEALAELRRCAGSQLNPEAVRALVDMIDSGREFPALIPRRLDPDEEIETVAQEA